MTRGSAGYVIVLASLLFVGGCGAAEGVAEIPVSEWWRSAIREVRLDDGTRCVVIVGYGGAAGGIDCNWSRP